MQDANMTNLPKLETFILLTNWANVNLCSSFMTSGGSYIFLRKFHDMRRAMKATEKIIVNPKSGEPLKKLSVSPARSAVPKFMNPKKRFLHPKKEPLFPSGTWSAIRLDHAGRSKLLKNAYTATNAIRQATVFWGII